MLRYIDKELTERGRLVKDKLGRKSEDLNIHVYNKKFPNKKLPVIQLWVDEAASLYKTTSDRNLNKMIKEAQEIIERIASTGRYIGIYLINVLQRASKDEISREIKINTMNWITFKQVDAGASKVAIGDETSALGLPQRVFAYKAGTEYVGFGKTPYSMWDKNVSKLEAQYKIKEDKQSVFDNDYSHWLEPDYTSDSDSVTRKNESINSSKEKNRIKLESDALKIKIDEINKLQSDIEQLIFERNQRDETIKDLMELNSKLQKEKTAAGNNVEDTIKSIKQLEYKNADTQRNDVIDIVDNTNMGTSPYKSLDLSKLKIKNK